MQGTIWLISVNQLSAKDPFAEPARRSVGSAGTSRTARRIRSDPASGLCASSLSIHAQPFRLGRCPGLSHCGVVHSIVPRHHELVRGHILDNAVDQNQFELQIAANLGIR